jgi:hypothetical protein
MYPDHLTIEDIVGVTKPAANESYVNVYPNPFTQGFTIEWKDIRVSDIRLFDITGRQVFHQQPGDTGTGSFRYDPSDVKLTKGMFFLQLQTDKGIVLKKLVRL